MSILDFYLFYLTLRPRVNAFAHFPFIPFPLSYQRFHVLWVYWLQNISYILCSLYPLSSIPFFLSLLFISSGTSGALWWCPHILSCPSLFFLTICAAYCCLAPFANTLSLLSFTRLIYPSLSSILSPLSLPLFIVSGDSSRASSAGYHTVYLLFNLHPSSQCSFLIYFFQELQMMGIWIYSSITIHPLIHHFYP